MAEAHTIFADGSWYFILNDLPASIQAAEITLLSLLKSDQEWHFQACNFRQRWPYIHPQINYVFKAEKPPVLEDKMFLGLLIADKPHLNLPEAFDPQVIANISSTNNWRNRMLTLKQMQLGPFLPNYSQSTRLAPQIQQMEPLEVDKIQERYTVGKITALPFYHYGSPIDPMNDRRRYSYPLDYYEKNKIVGENPSRIIIVVDLEDQIPYLTDELERLREQLGGVERAIQNHYEEIRRLRKQKRQLESRKATRYEAALRSALNMIESLPSMEEKDAKRRIEQGLTLVAATEDIVQV